MTPDELPADMEGRLTEALNDVERIGMTHEDVRIAVPLFDAVNRTRALLKAYQEQRRVLEEARGVIVDATLDDLCPLHSADVLAQIEAALNQKGDER
jgi:hypothetical protein